MHDRSAPTIRLVQRRELARLCNALAHAFLNDPISVYLFPEPGNRLRRLASNYRAVIPMLTREGAFYCDPELRAAAVWQAPSPRRPNAWQRGLFNLRIIAMMRSALGRGQILAETMQKTHLKEPHWYLGILGTHPEVQGRGIGSSLLAPILERCDAEGVLAYLESSKSSNIPFYQRHGFQVTGEIQIPDGPCLWPMLRDPH